MEFKGTQGEWVATEQSGAPGHCFVAQVFGHAGPVAQIEPTEDPAIATANARLIAAAPELLEALKPFAQFACDTPHVNEPECQNCKARAAIAKAFGRKRWEESS